MIPKPKKHKQRFEHRIEVVGESGRTTLYDVTETYEKQGFELVSSVVENYTYTLFFKRPV